ncbi:xylulokinase [Paenilisteria rocourtiae]|uniref:Xylulose kinase n=1 Tax=Listeria rocourtiae TaxID=647910 RepID=A0A4R6ZGK1_9LIST|nr:xylulokinase [Listeria rocourtiae]EUJ52298.1 xylulose kinase [Listeria rocourtiae FSL F6-920]MBC1435145.1 xylulokinase [Listeria rocourtiae]MBC1605770.1 xylulokinase [Listeria rocourtiae]TDR51064.1 xylulokinase [Listeria rocourtiae]
MKYVLGVDLGTSALKAVLFAENGEKVAEASAEYPIFADQAGFSEQNPSDWFDAFVFAATEIGKHPESRELAGISFSGQMHSLVLLDAKAEVLRRAILWNDVRTTRQCEAITKTLGESRLLDITKNKALEGFTLPKLLWVKEHEPEIWTRVSKFLLPKDYLGFRLTGTMHMDYSDAAGTLLLDLAQGAWSSEVLDAFGISEGICPDLVASTDQIGTLLPEIADMTGLPSGIPVFAGGADNACAAVGTGILEEGKALLSIGTSGVFLTYESDADKDYQGDLHLFHHASPDGYYSMGVTLAAGYSLSWFKEQFAPGESYVELLDGIKDIPVGADGLLFTPYIVGERTPYADSKIRGSFIGIDARHTRTHFAKAVLEGITFSLRDSMHLMETRAQKHFTAVISTGGGAQNKDWLQMQADILGVTIETLASEQGPALGAAMIAAVGSGIFSDLSSAVPAFIKKKATFEPNMANHAKYDGFYATYQAIYPATKPICERLN